MGYWRAADALIDHVTQKRNQEVERPYAAYWESQAYAILFLYRHYLELRLKELIIAYGGEPSHFDREHRLLKIWEELEKLDESSRTEELVEEVLTDLEIAKKIMGAFDDIDANSQTFRYPQDRKGKATIELRELI